MAHRIPKLKRIDLSKTKEVDGKTTHPDLNLKSDYLIRVFNTWAVVKVSQQWYGLTFIGHPDYDSLELDMGEDLTEVYEIVR